MNISNLSRNKLFRPLAGASVSMVCGVILLATPLVELSYDSLFLFATRPASTQVAIIEMDNAAHEQLGQIRGEKWDRELHADLLTRLTEDGCPLVVFDVLFLSEWEGEPGTDEALADFTDSEALAFSCTFSSSGLAPAPPISPFGESSVISTSLPYVIPSWSSNTPEKKKLVVSTCYCY